MSTRRIAIVALAVALAAVACPSPAAADDGRPSTLQRNIVYQCRALPTGTTVCEHVTERTGEWTVSIATAGRWVQAEVFQQVRRVREVHVRLEPPARVTRRECVSGCDGAYATYRTIQERPRAADGRLLAGGDCDAPTRADHGRPTSYDGWADAGVQHEGRCLGPGVHVLREPAEWVSRTAEVQAGGEFGVTIRNLRTGEHIADTRGHCGTRDPYGGWGGPDWPARYGCGERGDGVLEAPRAWWGDFRVNRATRQFERVEVDRNVEVEIVAWFEHVVGGRWHTAHVSKIVTLR